MEKPKLIGLDLDNTVIDYGPAYQALARDLQLAPSLVDRPTIRQALRLEDDEEDWQRFQAALYTSGLEAARPARGLFEFLHECKEQQIEICIVSHKTNTTPLRFGALDLRGPAQGWLVSNGIVPALVPAGNVCFCSSRAEKINRINQLGCDIFVDDLLEVLTDPGFPTNALKFWYCGKASGELTDSDIPQAVDFPALTSWLRTC